MVFNETGVTISCTNPECGCRLRIEQPCPHGDTYTCACGHHMAATAESPLSDLPA